MGKILLIITIVLAWNTAWCTRQVLVGVDSRKVIILEYWKFKEGRASNEMLVYNPMRVPIKVVFRKWHLRQMGEPEHTYAESDVLLSINKLRPNDYALFETACSEIRDLHRGLIEVFVNGESVGLYEITRQKTYPQAKITHGIIINQKSNAGGALQYEIIYETLKFKKRKIHRSRVEYLKETFHSSGFVNGDKENPYNIDLTNVVLTNLSKGEDSAYDLSLVSNGKLGSFEVRFTHLNPKRKIQQRSFLHMENKNTGQGTAFIIPSKINFNKKIKYRKRKKFQQGDLI